MKASWEYWYLRDLSDKVIMMSTFSTTESQAKQKTIPAQTPAEEPTSEEIQVAIGGDPAPDITPEEFNRLPDDRHRIPRMFRSMQKTFQGAKEKLQPKELSISQKITKQIVTDFNAHLDSQLQNIIDRKHSKLAGYLTDDIFYLMNKNFWPIGFSPKVYETPVISSYRGVLTDADFEELKKYQPHGYISLINDPNRGLLTNILIPDQITHSPGLRMLVHTELQNRANDRELLLEPSEINPHAIDQFRDPSTHDLIDQDEIVHEAGEALVKAYRNVLAKLDKYIPEKGAKATSFADSFIPEPEEKRKNS